MAESKKGEKDNGKVVSRLPMWLRGLQRAWCGILAGACSCTRGLDDVTGLREMGVFLHRFQGDSPTHGQIILTSSTVDA